MVEVGERKGISIKDYHRIPLKSPPGYKSTRLQDHLFVTVHALLLISLE